MILTRRRRKKRRRWKKMNECKQKAKEEVRKKVMKKTEENANLEGPFGVPRCGYPPNPNSVI